MVLDLKKCAWCGSEFKPKRSIALCCSRSCAAKYRAANAGVYPWRTEEVEVLERMAGVKPFQKIVESVQRLERKQGWHIRSVGSISSKIFALGLSVDCTEDNLSAQKLADALGISVRRVQYWVHKLGLPRDQICRHKMAISIKELRKWAEQNPDRLAGIEFYRLAWVFEDEVFAQRLSQIPEIKKGKPRHLRRTDTGKRYNSIIEASRDTFVSARTIHWRIQQGERTFTSGGIPWEILEA